MKRGTRVRYTGTQYGRLQNKLLIIDAFFTCIDDDYYYVKFVGDDNKYMLRKNKVQFLDKVIYPKVCVKPKNLPDRKSI